ncbi:MAG: hypothetical protein AB1486_34065, partial [Planctomycetota bacterium]
QVQGGDGRWAGLGGGQHRGAGDVRRGCKGAQEIATVGPGRSGSRPGGSGVFVRVVGGWWAGVVAEEFLEGRGAGTGDRRRVGRKTEAVENCFEDGRIGQKRDEVSARPSLIRDAQARIAYAKPG